MTQLLDMQIEQAKSPETQEQSRELAVQDSDESRELAVISAAQQKAQKHAQIDAVVGPVSNSAMVASAFNMIDPKNIGIADIANPVERIMQAVVSGDLSGMEAMLVGQAVALQGIFTSLSVKSAGAIRESNSQELLKLALRAQHQSRATIDALTNLKFPKQVILRQVNTVNGGGAQQVLNESGAVGRTENKLMRHEIAQSKLLPMEDIRNERSGLEHGTAYEARRNDQALETMAAVNRPEDTRWESPCCSKCLQGRSPG